MEVPYDPPADFPRNVLAIGGCPHSGLVCARLALIRLRWQAVYDNTVRERISNLHWRLYWVFTVPATTLLNQTSGYATNQLFSEPSFEENSANQIPRMLVLARLLIVT